MAFRVLPFSGYEPNSLYSLPKEGTQSNILLLYSYIKPPSKRTKKPNILRSIVRWAPLIKLAKHGKSKTASTSNTKNKTTKP